MITYFIFYSDLEYATQLSNTILKTNDNINLIGIDTEFSFKSIQLCNIQTPNIIITDENSHKKLTHNLHFDYIPITISHKHPVMVEKICNQVNKFTSDLKFPHKLDLHNYRKYVYNELQKLKFNTTFCGTQYLIDCIMYAHENPKCDITNLSLKEFYIPISQKYNTDISTITWSIQYTIYDMYKSTSTIFRKNIYGVDYGITVQKIIQVFSNLY